MKKIVALMLSMLLVLGCAAMAEGAGKTAAVMELSNIQMSDGTQTQTLGDLVVTAILDAAGDPTFVLTADEGNEYLAALAGKITTDGKLAITMEGVDATYSGDIAELAQQAGTAASQIAQFTEALPQLPEAMRQMIPELDSFVLPAVPGVPIPKLDFSALLANFITGEADGATTFAIPYEQFVALLDMVTEYAGLLGNQIPNIDQVTAMIDQLKANNQGFAVDGTIVDDGTTQTVVFNVLVVDGGVTGDTPAFVLTLTTAENSFALAAAQSADSEAMITLSVTSDPSVPRMDVELNAMGAGMAFRMYPDNGMQFIELTASTGDEVAVLFGYGNRNGMDGVLFTANASTGSFSISLNTVKGDDGVRSGTLEVEANGMLLSADVNMYLDEASPVEIEWPTTEKDLTELDDSVMQEAIAPLMEYINSLSNAA